MPRHDSVRPALLLALTLIGLGGAVAACGRGPREEADRTGEASASADESGARKKIDRAARGPTKSAEACVKCHEEQTRFWAYGAHSKLSCADCHGIERDHVETGMAPEVAGNAQCLACHPLVRAGAKAHVAEAEIFEHHLKFVEKKHVITVDRGKVKGRCIYCHDPHLGE